MHSSNLAVLIGVTKAFHTNPSVIAGFMVPGSRTALAGFVVLSSLAELVSHRVAVDSVSHRAGK